MCDGAFNRQIQRGDFGVILFDSEGRVVDGRARKFFCRASICAEIWAALELAVKEENSITIYSDCQILTKAIHDQPDQWPWEAASILALITQLLTNHTGISIIHVGRNEVHGADHIAKMARDERIPNFWDLV
ncbi:hypothetical protein LINPERHAP2_LOCUS23075 [Linum perenne]